MTEDLPNMAKPTCAHRPPPGWEPLAWRHTEDGGVWTRRPRCPTFLLNTGDQCGQPGNPMPPHHCRNHSLPIESSATVKCRQCLAISKAETDRRRLAERGRKAAAREAPRKRRPTKPWQWPPGAVEAARVTAIERGKRAKERDSELAAMADDQLAALDPLIRAADALKRDSTAENVARLLAAKPEALDPDRLRTLQRPEPITLREGLYAAPTVSEVYQLCARTAHQFLGFEAYGLLRRALRGYFRKAAQEERPQASE